MHAISIVTVCWNSYDFADLLLESVNLYSAFDHEIIIVDNTIDPRPISYQKANVLIQRNNIGHGAGLNLGAQHAKHPYVLFLDIDCHFLRRGWEKAFFEAMEGYDVIAGRGVPAKPIRPACMFLKQEVAQKYDWRPTPGYKGHRITPEGFDVAIQAYHQMVKDDVAIRLIDSQPNRYSTNNGEEWCINDIPFIYHHWHGSHLKERQVDFPNVDLAQDKLNLFSKIPWRIL